MGKGVRDLDRGYSRILRALNSFRGKEIVTGLQAGDKTEDGSMDVARLGAIHEFGASIDMRARKQTVYRKLNAKGNKFVKKGRFVSADKSNFAQDFSVGAHTINIPERSFMRSTYDDKNRSWNDKAIQQIKLVASGKKDAAGAMGVIGLTIQRDIQKKIVDGPFTPNAPATVRNKKSARPLIDTGRVRQSVRFVVRARGRNKQ